MPELGWKEAILKVLEEADEPMHYVEITEAITTAGYKTKIGATPAASVAATISMSMRDEGERSPFVRVSRGLYALTRATSPLAPTPPEEDETGFVNAFGMYWKRSNVRWKTLPQLLGKQLVGSQPVDFCQQNGVYLLHDGSKVIYVGRTTDQPLGVRLKQHTFDRLSGRWDRFSWFGIFSVNERGELSDAPPDAFDVTNLITTMEALLIEGLEPPQNRKRGDDFSAVEFLQVEDPEIQRAQAFQLIEELKDKL